jgi:hypothetical protein
VQKLTPLTAFQPGIRRFLHKACVQGAVLRRLFIHTRGSAPLCAPEAQARPEHPFFYTEGCRFKSCRARHITLFLKGN